MAVVDWEALQGYEVELRQSVPFEGERFRKGVFDYYDHEHHRWTLTLRAATPDRPAIAMRIPSIWLNERRWRDHFRALPMRYTPDEEMAVAVNTALADAERAERRAKRRGSSGES